MSARAARVLRIVGVLACVLVTRSAAVAQTPATPAEQKPTTWSSATRTIELFPPADVYPVYVADPHRPTNLVANNFYTTTRIPTARSPRVVLAGGGRFGILKFAPAADTGRSWQISLEAGFDALFDSQNKLDGLGWDGNYGVMVTTAAGALGLKFAVLHSSAHLGDEYADRTGIERVNYTREELAVGVSWLLRPSLRVYGEAGVAYTMRSEQQEPWRLQAGVEYERRPTLFGSRMAWYAAADLSTLQERGFRLDNALEGGLVTRNGSRAYRLFIQFYDGRPTLAQFTRYPETSLGLGFKVDL
jgi:hypothetical protein